jgi:hypothetical protein
MMVGLTDQIFMPERPGTIHNNPKITATNLNKSGIIDDICSLYVLEYLSSGYELGADEWAQTFNAILDKFRDDAGFEFLSAEVEGKKVPKKVDPKKYDQFLASKTDFFKKDAEDLRESFLKNLLTIDELHTIVEEPNKVFLDQVLIEKSNTVDDVTKDNFIEPVLNFPKNATLRLSGLDFWVFYLFAWETGLISKDYKTNSPANINTKKEPNRAKFNKEKIILANREAGLEATTVADASLTWMPLYKTVRRRNSSGPQPGKLDFFTESDKDQYYGGDDDSDHVPDDTFSSLLDFLPLLPEEALTREEIFSIYEENSWLRLGTGANSKKIPNDALYYPIGKSGEFLNGKYPNSPYFNPIYKKCLNVVASIASLYPEKTLKLFVTVLQELLDSAEESPNANFLTESEAGDKNRKVDLTPQALKPSDHQCFLLENIRPIATAKDNLQKVKDTRYKNLGAIYGTRSPGNIISAIQHGEKSDEVDALLNLCPEIYALLTPFIEVYRVEYQKDDKKKLRPIREAKIPFPNFIDSSDIDAIMNGQYGRFPGAGIKSFTWSLDGTQPEEVENNISAKLELHFQTIQDLFSLNTDQAAGGKEPGYLDLIIASPGVDDNKSSNGGSNNIQPAESKPQLDSTACFEAEIMDFDPRNFEVKICAGWSVPPNFADIVNELEFSRDQGPDYGKKLQAAIMTSKIPLFLTLTEHELIFNENGSVDLNVFYQARLSGLARSPAADIFGSTFDFNLNNLNFLDAQIDKLENQKSEIAQRAVKDQKQNNDDETVEDINSELESLLEQKSSIIRENKGKKYKRFLDKLYSSNKIYSYKANQKKLLRDENSPAMRALYAKRRASSVEYKNGFNPQQPTGADASLYQEAAETIQSIASAKEESEEGNKIKAALAEIKSIEDARKAADGTLEIPFFYLGDLIDEVVGNLGDLTDKDKGSLQIILSQVELLDPLLAYQIKEISIPCSNDRSKLITKAISQVDPMRYKAFTGIKFMTNIGSIPISLEFFQEWFINNIVKPQADKYNLLRFIKTVCSSLISRAFNSLCFEDGPKFSLRFDTATFNFDQSYAGKNITSTTLAQSKSRAQESSCGKLSGAPSIPAFIVASMDSRPKTGNYNHDLDVGIYHYYLGAACGIAKSIKFDRTGIPYYREARLQRTSALSALQLREMYNISIEMVGNTIHKNGQYIYVNPIAIGAGSAKTRSTVPNLARLLGIGGYYMITGISHTVSSAGFNVSLQGLQEGIDFSGVGDTVQLVEFSNLELAGKTENFLPLTEFLNHY